MERWERELARLKDVDAPASTKTRMEAGATGDGMPPTSNRAQRIAAGVVACVVFLLGAALVVAAFRSPDGPIVAVDRTGAVLTLSAEPNDAVATLSYDGDTVEPVVDSYCWNQENGAQRCADVAMADPFDADGFLIVPQGTSFTLVNEDDADPVTLSIARGNDPYEAGSPTSVDELARVEPGAHVLTVTANWEGRGENVTFHFPVYVDAVSSSPSPSPSSGTSPSASSTSDVELQALLAGSSWQLGGLDGAMLDMDEPPTLIFGGQRLGGSTGCNRYGADRWDIAEGRLEVGDIAMTAALCSDGTDAIEEGFLGAIGGKPTVVLGGSTLTLTGDDHELVLDRIDVEQEDIIGSFLDCAWWDRTELPRAGAVLLPAPPHYFTVNLSWMRANDGVRRIAGSSDPAEDSRWIVVRDGLVIAEIDYPSLGGTACPGVLD